MAHALPSSLRLEVFKRCRNSKVELNSRHALFRGRSPTTVALCLSSRHYAGGFGGPTPGQIDLQAEDAEESTQSERKTPRSNWSPTLFKMFESAATTFASILVLGLAGYGYHRVRRYLDQISYFGPFWRPVIQNSG